MKATKPKKPLCYCEINGGRCDGQGPCPPPKKQIRELLALLERDDEEAS